MFGDPPDGDWTGVVGRFAGPTIAILLATFSFLLAFTLGFVAEPEARFAAFNEISLSQRTLGIGLAAGLSLLATVSALWVARKQEEPERAVWRTAMALSPLVVSSFLPVLFQPEAWNGREIAFLGYALGVGLALERLTTPSLMAIAEMRGGRYFADSFARLARHKLADWLCLAIVLGLVGWYIARVGTLTNISHRKLMTASSDLAEYDNLFFNALRGHPFRSPAIAGHLEDFSSLQGHAEFGLYLLLPFYALSPGAHALLWIQTCLVAFTSVPIYLLARHRLGKVGGLAFVVAYFFMPSVQQPNFYDFHFTPLSMFFVAWLLFSLSLLAEDPKSRRRAVPVYVFLGLSFLCREDISIGTAVLGVFLILSRSLVQHGLIIAIASAAYFVFMKFTFMPLFGRWWFDNMYDDLKAQGAEGFGAILMTLISNPAFVLRSMLIEPKLLYVLHMTVPVLALWLRRPLLWLAFLPGLVATLLVTNRPPMFQASFQYTYLWVPYVLGAAILAARRGAKGAGTYVGLVVVGFALAGQMGVFPTGEKILGGFSVKTFEMSDAEKKRYANLKAIIALIPPDGVVAATEAEGPHVSSRLVMYSLKYTLGPFPEYLLISHPHHRGEKAHVTAALESGKYGVIAQKGQFVLAKRGADPKDNDVLWRKVGRRSHGKRRSSGPRR